MASSPEEARGSSGGGVAVENGEPVKMTTWTMDE
jgi:hypothetical protein